SVSVIVFSFFFQAEDGIRDRTVTGVQTCALPIFDVGVDQAFLRLERRRYRDRRGIRAAAAEGGDVSLLVDPLESGDDDDRPLVRSEERRVGKECRSGVWPEHCDREVTGSRSMGWR